MSLNDISYEIANITHAQEICELINLAHKVMKKSIHANIPRITIKKIKEIFNKSNTKFLITYKDNRIVSTILINHLENKVYLELLAIHPLVKSGYGRKVLKITEKYIFYTLEESTIILNVYLTLPKLFKYYEYQGYKRTGQLKKVAINKNINDVRIVEFMTKKVTF